MRSKYCVMFACPVIPLLYLLPPKRNVFSFERASHQISSSKRPISVLVSSLNRTASYNPLVFQAAGLLGPPARFEASKLKVVFMGEAIEKYTEFFPRTYILSHCDMTANLTLAISNSINRDQLKGWYNKDDVVAEWRMVKEDLCLHVHCHVSGPNHLLDIAAEFRYHIFAKELPLVLKAMIYGDSILFKEHPELMDTLVWVYFHSSSKKYNRVECWGALKDAAERIEGHQFQRLLSSTQEVHHPLQEKWGTPKSILHALVSFLLLVRLHCHIQDPVHQHQPEPTGTVLYKKLVVDGVENYSFKMILFRIMTTAAPALHKM